MKRDNRNSIKHFLVASIVFVVFMAGSLAIFFYSVQNSVEESVGDTIDSHVKRQGYILQTVLDDQFEFLEGTAKYVGSQADLFCDDNMELIGALSETTSFERVAVIDCDGLSHYSDGTVKNVYGREYFQESLAGNRSLSEPLVSKVDGESKVVLCVPVYRGKEIVGALGASYNLSALGSTMFNDIYDGAGYCMITSSDGSIIALEGNKGSTSIDTNDNFFTYYKRTRFLKGSLVSMQADFSQRRSGRVKLRSNGQNSYLTYMPLELNDWYLCYVVPVSKARESYAFIGHYEKNLGVVLLVGGVALLLFLVLTSAHRERALKKFAHTDALTGCQNKLNTKESINRWLEDPYCQTSSALQAILMMDIDKFKGINDVYGHTVGDLVLQAVGKTLRGFFRDDDIVGRIGGDEFLIMMRNVSKPEDVEKKADALRQMINEIKVEGLNQTITVSIGIAFAPTNGRTYEELYLNADKALYQVKRNGRNGCAVYKNHGDAEEIAPARTVVYKMTPEQEELLKKVEGGEAADSQGAEPVKEQAGKAAGGLEKETAEQTGQPTESKDGGQE